ncbi:MAG: HIT domain-containing protein [Candidatus Pacebacteria bacterium]|nr:HIT domain-containing protein [Candidatus Paceibacterota bacterium]
MPDNDCIFCQIINKEIPGSIRFENEKWLAFDDNHKTAPEHVLLVPKQHLDSIEDIDITDDNFHSELLQIARTVAKEIGISQNYKIFLNTGKQVQAVHHLHVHIMGGWKKEKNILGLDKDSVDLINS